MAEVEDLDDRRMVDSVDRAGFIKEACRQLGVARTLRKEDLDGDAALDGFMERLEHSAHPAGAELADDFVGANSIRCWGG